MIENIDFANRVDLSCCGALRYPPKPPYGREHGYDKEGTAIGLVRMAIPPSKVYIDGRRMRLSLFLERLSVAVAVN